MREIACPWNPDCDRETCWGCRVPDDRKAHLIALLDRWKRWKIINDIARQACGMGGGDEEIQNLEMDVRGGVGL